MKHKLLLVDDDRSLTTSLKRALHREPYEIYVASSADEALTILASEDIDVVISDEKMPGMSGSEFLAIVSKKYPETIRIILTGHASLDVAIRSINEGEIYRFFTKPANTVDLAVTIRQAIRHKALLAESRRLLQLFRHQKAVLQELEREHPGISSVTRESDGAVMLPDVDGDFDALIVKITDEVNEYMRITPEQD